MTRKGVNFKNVARASLKYVARVGLSLMQRYLDKRVFPEESISSKVNAKVLPQEIIKHSENGIHLDDRERFVFDDLYCRFAEQNPRKIKR